MKGSKRIRANDEISSPKVRLIGQNGEQMGVFDLQTAKRKALAAGLDIVEVSPNTDPPVCRLLDYGKFRFERIKGAKQKGSGLKKKTKPQQIKEVKFRPTIDIGDYHVKLRMINRFIEGNNKVKVVVRFKGRELTHTELGVDLVKRVEADLGESVDIEQAAKLEGRQLVMVMAPSSAKLKAIRKEKGSEDNVSKTENP